VHGTGNLYDPLGSAASHGCIRLATGAITWLARRVGPGVPLTVSR
jgi:lipoprotein-anchoring transpeptidase ErfK/SrfK